MLLDSVRKLLGRQPPPVVMRVPRTSGAASVAVTTALPDDDDPIWPTARIAVAEKLWGPGFLFPGGEDETIRLATPIGLSAASSLLLLGAGCGGPTRAIIAAFGVWVGGYEANPRLVTLANDRNARSGGGRRGQVEPWDPGAPKFPPHYYHHGMALEPLSGSDPEATLAAVATALKPGAHLVLVETVADLPLDPADAQIATWARLAHRGADLPSELTITRLLASLGFDVRIVEDVTHRHMHHALQGWLTAVEAMGSMAPPLRQTAVMVREAELWLLRLKLMQTGKLRMVRWHSIGR
jgi:hypothetical protein